jgi:hypothetical protein
MIRMVLDFRLLFLFVAIALYCSYMLRVKLFEKETMYKSNYGGSRSYAPREMTKVVCSDCGKECENEKKIDHMASQVKNMKNCIFNFHCPPYDTYLDQGPKLDETLKPVLSMGGGIKMIPVGSPAIRNAIDKYQPLLGLHGHIHESKASQKLIAVQDLNSLLPKIPETAGTVLGADIAILYEYREETDDVNLPPIVWGDMRYPEILKGKVRHLKSHSIASRRNSCKLNMKSGCLIILHLKSRT